MNVAINQRRFFALFALLSVIVLAFYGWRQYTLYNPNRVHAMTEITKNMKTVCFGRYLVDIPAQAEFSIGNAYIDDIKVEYIGKLASERIFSDKVKKREAELRAAKHETEGVQLREAIDINGGKQRLLVFREDGSDVSLSLIETSVRSGTDEWLIGDSAVEEYVAETKHIVTQLAALVTPRDMNDIPKIPGICTDNGFIAGKAFERENLPFNMRLKTPAFSFSILSETSGKRESGQTLWDRIDKANKMSQEFYKVQSKSLRRAEVIVDQRKGQEHISMLPVEENTESFDANAEIYGDGTPKSPTFKISMTVNRPTVPDPEIKTLSNAEALALWDAVLKSIRPRPGAF